MKRVIAFLCAALLAGLCFSCGKKDKDPEKPGQPETVPLLTLYTEPLRVATQREGVTVTLQALEYEPTLSFPRPTVDLWEEALEPGREYELDARLSEGIPEYRLFILQGENIAIHDLVYDGKDGKSVFEIEGGPWAPAPIDESSPMVNLCRTLAVARAEERRFGYFYAIANAISTLRGVYNEWPPDDPESGAYHVPPWLFEAYAAALFPHMEMPGQVDWEWVGTDSSNGQYLIYPAYSTWIWADYKSAARNPDGSWDVTVTLGTTADDETADKIITLAPNEAYHPNSPFEYHVVMGEDEWDGSWDVAPPPPDYIVGTWKASLDSFNAAYLEIFEDGMAGLYKGDNTETSQVYEIYRGFVAHTADGAGEIAMSMSFNLDWHIYEGEGGEPVPEGFEGTYTVRHEWEGEQQVLYVSANDGADPLFGKKELKMEWVPKTLQNDYMTDIEAMG
ncbi:MAG: hypothetical protein FWH26_00385 [Oscillospiraceae bacterium]|nr:hypothetical protein [Oscillospiraceae bacterium]